MRSLSASVSELEPEGAYQVLARARELEKQGRDIVHLEIGEPDFRTGANVCSAGIAAINSGLTRYSPAAGIMELREAIAQAVCVSHGIDVSNENVVVGPGAKPHLFFPAMALVDPGDEVVYPDPGFPTYQAMTKVVGGKPVPVSLKEASGFSYDLEMLRDRVNERTKLIVINSPSNPTGGVMPQEDLEVIAELAEKYDCWVLSDEIYRKMCFDEDVGHSIASIGSMKDRTIIVDGFSKTYAMTGWRLGYSVMPSDLAKKVSMLLVHAVGCTAEFTQHAGIEALTGSQKHPQKMLAHYRERRDLMVEGLRKISGVSCETPAGAFYAFPNIRETGFSSKDLANRLLEEAGVALLPGDSFGPGGEGYLRLCYANSKAKISDAIERIERFLC